ncbi:MAG: hypothetical protein A2137_01075 [Chloroflexi bacterium RBG_16_58_8]|nr:MAG: hypothetical protein A2137_01075 [Chloroflexi bacterium RBG_16_58_8]
MLYQESFEGLTADHWQLDKGWDIMAESGGNRALRGQGHVWARYTGDSWSDFTFKLRVKLVRGIIHLNYRLSGPTRYFIGFGEGTLYLNKSTADGQFPRLAEKNEAHAAGQWYQVEIKGQGGKLEVSVDGSLKLSYTDATPLTGGGIALEALDETEVWVDDVSVTWQAAAVTGFTWVKTGGPIGGLGYDVRMQPGHPDDLFVTDSWSGVNVSYDGGRTWTASNAGIVTRTGLSGDAIPVFSLSTDPTRPDVLWAGTQQSRGIYKSTDAGRTWVEKDNGVTEGQEITFRGFTVDPGNPDVVYAAAEISSFGWAGQPRNGREFDMVRGVVYKTADGGNSWTAVWRGDNLARYVLIDPRDSRVLYVSTGLFDREAANSDPARALPGGEGILKSTDGGKTWQVLNGANGLNNLYLGTLFMKPDNPDVLLAGAGNNAYLQNSGAYLTTDGGRTWQPVIKSQQPISAVEYATSDPNIAYAAGPDAVYRSADGGKTWQKVTQSFSWGAPGTRAGFPIDLQVDPRNADRLFANAYGGGNFLSEDGGRTWVIASHGYTGAQLHDIQVSAREPYTVFVIGRTGPFRSYDWGETWEGLTYEPAVYAEWYAVALDPQNPNNVIVSDEHQGVLLRSADQGSHWTQVFKHPQVDASNASKRMGFRALAFAPSNPNIVYAGMAMGRNLIDQGVAGPSFGIFKSADGGRTWRESNDARSATQNINVLAVDPSNENTVYAGTLKSGVLKSMDGGKTWQAANQGLPIPDIRSLAADPQGPQILYAGAENGGIYKSTDGGAVWTPVSRGMDAQASIRAIAVDLAHRGTVYAADVRTGVYRSTDGGLTWSKMNDGLRTRAVKALAISSDGTMLYAATEGEGVFRIDLAGAVK